MADDIGPDPLLVLVAARPIEVNNRYRGQLIAARALSHPSLSREARMKMIQEYAEAHLAWSNAEAIAKARIAERAGLLRHQDSDDGAAVFEIARRDG